MRVYTCTFGIRIGATRAQTYEKQLAERWQKRLAVRGFGFFFPTHLYYNNNINTRFRPARACGKTTAAAPPPPPLLLLLLSFGGLHRRRCSSRSHKLHIRRVASRAVFVCVSCPPIYMYYYYYYFNICFLFLKKNMHTCIMHDESQLWQWGGNFFFGVSCRFVYASCIPGRPPIIVITAKNNGRFERNLRRRGDDIIICLHYYYCLL